MRRLSNKDLQAVIDAAKTAMNHWADECSFVDILGKERYADQLREAARMELLFIKAHAEQRRRSTKPNRKIA